MTDPTTLTAEYISEIAATVRNGEGDERWSVKVFLIHENGTTREIECVGCCRKSRLIRHQFFTMKGQYKINDYDNRKQFIHDSITETEPLSLDAIERYLQKADGIGPQAAKKIVGEFGEKALEICREEPGEVNKLCGIRNLDALLRLQKILIAGKTLERITIELDSLLAGHYFPKQTAQWALEIWGADAARIIRENPFVLRRKSGIGFLKCDALYKILGLDPLAMTRQMHCALYAVESDDSGSTWVLTSDVVTAIRKQIGGTEVRPGGAIQQAVEQEFLRERTKEKVSYLAVTKHADAESSLAADLVAAYREGIDDDGF